MNIQRFVAVILLLALLVPSAAFAAETKGSLSVAFADTDCIGEPAEFNVYRVADEDGRLLEPFRGYAVELDLSNGEKWPSAAETLKGFVRKDSPAPSFKAVMGSNGTFTVSDMPLGTYLVVGNDFVKGGAKYDIQPFLIPIPCMGDMDASATVKIKKSELPPSAPVIRKVLKVWNDGGSRRRPDSITVELLQDGYVYDSVELSEDNNWRYTWSDLPGGHEWLVVENDVPAGYTTSTSLDGITFVIRNRLKRTPSRPERPEPPTETVEIKEPPVPKEKFPQTGSQWGTVAALACAGSGCLLAGTAGLALSNKGKEGDAK